MLICTTGQKVQWGLFVCLHVCSQHEVINDCKSTVPFKFLQLKFIFNSYMELDLCFRGCSYEPG